MLLLLLFAVGVAGSSFSVLPVSLAVDPQTYVTIYVAELDVGNPSLRQVLAINFNLNGIYTAKSPHLYSSTYSAAANGSDFITISGNLYNIPVRPLFDLDNLKQFCSRCDGWLGMNAQSLFWRLWPSISFSAGSVMLGAVNDEFTGFTSCPFYATSCSIVASDGLCTTTATVYNQTYRLRFSSDSRTFLPRQLYDQYIGGRNVYDRREWPSLPIYPTTLTELPSEMLNIFGRLGMYFVPQCREPAVIKLEQWSFITQNIQNLRKLYILPDDNTTDLISLGVSGWRSTILHVDSVHNVMLFRSYLNYPHISPANLLFFTLCLTIFVRWKLSDTGLISWSRPDHRQNVANMVYMMFAVIISIVACVLEPTRNILSDYPLIYIMTCSIVGICSAALAFTFILASNMPTVDKDMYFRVNLVKDIVFEYLLLTAMWLLMLERRFDALSNTATTLIVLLAVDNLTFYIAAITIYYLYFGFGAAFRHSEFGLFTFIMFPMLYFYHLALTYLYFVRPYMLYLTAHVSVDMPFAIYEIIVMCIFAAAFYRARAYERKYARQIIPPLLNPKSKDT